VPISLWIALAVFAALLVGAWSYAAVKAARVWREGRRVANALSAAAANVAGRAAEIEARAERLRGRLERVDQAKAGLQRDLDTLNVVVAELRELGTQVASVSALVPAK
jgi:hypothetical protein